MDLRLLSQERPPRALVVAAHPDDETLGAGILLSRLPGAGVIHTTDGAPRDPRFIARIFTGTRDEYRQARRRELEAAMALAGIGPERLLTLGAADQEAAMEMPRLARDLARLFRELAPEVVLTHAYEGGHPDHDATAFAVRAAAELLRREGVEPPALGEMALYRAALEGAEARRLATYEFLPALAPADTPVTRIDLDDEERALKERMLAGFPTQAGTLKWFLPPVAELFRPAPPCDFTRPPHAGPLQYEIWRFPLSGERWRELAKEAAAELGLGLEERL